MTVMFDVQFCRFGGVVRCVMCVTLGTVCMMGRRLVIASFVMHGCFAMMARSVFVMLSRLTMMLCRLFGHMPLLFNLESSSEDRSYWVFVNAMLSACEHCWNGQRVRRAFKDCLSLVF